MPNIANKVLISTDFAEDRNCESFLTYISSKTVVLKDEELLYERLDFLLRKQNCFFNAV